jgi:ATP-binding cassette subfamily A (ABC1) protein 3
MSITKFGGPILYLIVNAFLLLAILVWVDSGTRKPRSLRKHKNPHLGSESRYELNDASVATAEPGVLSDDLLRVVNVSKSFNGKNVTDDVSMSIPKDTIFALLGPNGAGKTTTFNMIRELAIL